MSKFKLTKRSSNYSDAELECLLSHLEAYPTLAAGYRPGSELAPADFQLAWDAIAEQISALGGDYTSKRTGTDVKKKWIDLKSRARRKANKVALEMNESGGYRSSTKVTAIEKRVLELMSQFEGKTEKNSDKPVQNLQIVKVYSYRNDSDSENVSKHSIDHEEENNDNSGSETDTILEELKSKTNEAKKKRLSEAFVNEEENNENSMSETDTLLEELKSKTNEAKKKRLSEAFANAGIDPSPKRLKLSEDEQLQQLFSTQQEISSDLHSIKDILKKCQNSIEKLALLKRAELQLKCAKHGVNFDDLLD